jgi:hypothetical protein
MAIEAIWEDQYNQPVASLAAHLSISAQNLLPFEG